MVYRLTKKLLSITEAARALGVSRQRVHQLISSGKIKAIRVGRQYVIPSQELQKYTRRKRHEKKADDIRECR